MTVNTTDITSGPYTGNGVTDTFAYDFRIEEEDQLTVYQTTAAGVLTTLTLTTDYTITGVGNDSGGNVVLNSALTSGYTLYIRSNYSLTQETDFSSQGAFDPEIHEAAMDKITFLLQQQDDQLTRAVKLPDSYSGGASAELPAPEAEKYVRWNAAATALENVDAVANQGLDTDDSPQFVDLTLTDDLLLASGSVINFDSGDVTLTHSADTLTLSGGEFVCGTFTSTGIDDNATSEMLQLADNELTLGSASTTFVSKHVSDDASIFFSGGNASNSGANFILYGGTTASTANDFRLRAGGTDKIYRDDSASTITFADTGYFGDSTTGVTLNPNGWIAGGTDEGYITLYGDAGASDGFRVFDTGRALVGDTSANPTPDGTLHVYSGSAGAVTAYVGADDAVFESSGEGGASVLTPDASFGYVVFGSPSLSVGGTIQWKYDDALLKLSSRLIGSSIQLSPDNNVPNLTLSGASGSELAEFAGLVQLENGKDIRFKNAAGTAYQLLKVSTGDDLVIGNTNAFAFDDMYLEVASGHTGFARVDGTSTFYWTSAGVRFKKDITFDNNLGINFVDSVGSAYEIVSVDSGDDIYLGNNGLDDLYINVASSHSGYLRNNSSTVLEWNSSGIDVTGNITLDSGNYIGVGSAHSLLFDTSSGHTLRGAGGINFCIDSDNNSTTEEFYWGKDAGIKSTATELMTLSEAGALTLSGNYVGLSAAQTGVGISITANSLTTGKAAYFYSDSADTSNRRVVEIVNDNPLANATTALKVVQDAAAVTLEIEQNADSTGLFVDHNGNGRAVDIDTVATTGFGLYVAGSSLTTGSLAYLYSDSSDTGTRNLVEIVNDNTLATGAVALSIQQDANQYSAYIEKTATGAGSNLFLKNEGAGSNLVLDQNGDGKALNILASNETADVIQATANSLTTGSIAKFSSSSADTSSRNLVEVINDSSASTGTTCLQITQDAPQIAVRINQNADNLAMYIHTDNTTADTFHIVSDDLTSGSVAVFDSNSSSTTARDLVKIINDNANSSNVTPLSIQQDSATSTNFYKHITIGSLTIWESDGTTANGNLSGTAGDICLNGGSGTGQCAHCEGGTTWTDM